MNDDADRTEAMRALAARLGVQFTRLDYLDRALTHASIAGQGQPIEGNYESLEFLGDAALSLAVAHYLYEWAPDRTPGEYSRRRAAVVNRRCLARVAKRLGIDRAVRLGKGEELSGGRGRAGLLEDCLEAVIGAVYLDQGWNAVLEFIGRAFREELKRTQPLDDLGDYKSRLQQYCQAERISLPEFVVVRSEGPDHKKEFEVEVWLRGEPAGRGIGCTKKEAEQRAAQVALERGRIFLER